MNNHQLSINRYPSYKDSGIDWLGQVPEHWDIKKFNHIAQIVEGQIDPKEEPYVNYILIAPNHIESGTGSLLYKETAFDQGAESGKYLFRTNDVIYSKIRPALKKVWKANFSGICSADMYPIRLPRERIESDYFIFLCLSESFSDFMIATSMRVAMPKVNRNDFHECHFAIPPLSEQRSIAHYLDTKTAQIDRKIDLLTQKAKSYAELKRSLINETVTRGLDRSVVMKDSAIGEVPEHWEIKHLKNLAEIKGGKDSIEVELEEGDYPIYGSGGVFGRASKYLYGKPSVLLGRKGTIDKPLFVTEPFWSVDTMFYTEIKNSIYPKFFYYQCLIIEFGLYQYGSAVPSMAQNVLRQILFATPPLSEQKTIAHYLDTKTTQIDQIIQTINTQIEKLKELRKTLINDVVTGKIRVTEP